MTLVRWVVQVVILAIGGLVVGFFIGLIPGGIQWILLIGGLVYLGWFGIGTWLYRRHLRRHRYLSAHPERITPEAIDRHVREEGRLLRWGWL